MKERERKRRKKMGFIHKMEKEERNKNREKRNEESINLYT